MNWLFWGPLGAASLHIVEEFLYPGSFTAWYRRYKPDRAASITPRFLVIINALLLVVCYDVGVLGPRPNGVALWLTVMALLAANACWHVVGTIETRTYSPGVVTGLLIYVPMALYGYVRFLRSGQASVATAIIACLIGASYQVWADALHRWRVRRSTA
jgi:hypothetical protein